MSKSRTDPSARTERLPDGAALDYAPANEQGVVFLFSQLARRRFGLRVESVKGGYPDCIAYQGTKKIRIEFEFRSRNFKLHKHDPRKCDWIVCWAHDWPSAPKHLRIVELRAEYGLGFNVWLQPVGQPYADGLAELNSWPHWSVPSRATPRDLLLFHRTAPDSFIRDVFTLSSHVIHDKAKNKPGKDWFGSIRRVCTLHAPLHYSELCDNKVLRTAGFVRNRVQIRCKVTEYWPELYRMIVARNPSLEKKLKPYGPMALP